MSLPMNNSDKIVDDIDIEFEGSLPSLNTNSLYERFTTQRRILK